MHSEPCGEHINFTESVSLSVCLSACMHETTPQLLDYFYFHLDYMHSVMTLHKDLHAFLRISQYIDVLNQTVHNNNIQGMDRK
jgi:hypothetical protein